GDGSTVGALRRVRSGARHPSAADQQAAGLAVHLAAGGLGATQATAPRSPRVRPPLARVRGPQALPRRGADVPGISAAQAQGDQVRRRQALTTVLNPLGPPDTHPRLRSDPRDPISRIPGLRYRPRTLLTI